MPTKYVKGDDVRVRADKFDGNGEKDELNMTWSERWLHDGHGEWCLGKVSFVFRKQRGKPQKYRIRYHEGTVMECLEKDIERTPELEEAREDRVSSSVEREEDEQLNVGDRNDEDDDDRHPMEREEEEVNGNTGTVELDSDEDEAYEEDETVTVGGTLYRVREVKRQKTRAEDKDSDNEDENIIKMGETVTAGDYSWKRIEGITKDVREEPHFETTFKTNLFNDFTQEIDIFRALMPLDREQLLHIVRENADEDGDKRVTSGTHKGAIKSKQARCKYCQIRKRKAKETGVSPPTCFQCSFHEVAVCRKHNCWERHLAEVRQNQRDGFEI